MFLNDLLFQFATFDNYTSIKESLTELKIRFLANTVLIPDERLFHEEFIKLNLSDDITITCKPPSGNSFYTNCKSPREFINDLISENDYRDPDDIYEFEIVIRKKSSSEICVYYTDVFFKYLTQLRPAVIASKLNPILENHKYCTFVLKNEKNISFNTETLYFISENIKHYITPNVSFSRIELHEKHEKICNCKTQIMMFPNDFHLIKRCDHFKEFNIHLDKLSVIYGVLSLYDISELSEKTIYAKLIGYRQVVSEIQFEDISGKYEVQFHKIFNWIYEGGNLYDKIGLCRNILSIDMQNNNLSLITENTLNSILSNYKIYLKENVKEYIEIKNTVITNLLEITRTTDEIVDSYTGEFKKLLLGQFTFFLTIFVMNSIYANSISNIFNDSISTISYCFCTISIIYSIYLFTTKDSKLSRIEKYYNKIRDQYSKILNENDLNSIFNDSENIIADKNYVNTSLIRTILIWILINLLIIAFVFYMNKHL